MKLLSTFIGALVAGNTEWPASSFEVNRDFNYYKFRR
jgi:hypothetical protein